MCVSPEDFTALIKLGFISGALFISPFWQICLSWLIDSIHVVSDGG
jgi:hypothetical protein